MTLKYLKHQAHVIFHSGCIMEVTLKLPLEGKVIMLWTAGGGGGGQEEDGGGGQGRTHSDDRGRTLTVVMPEEKTIKRMKSIGLL